MLEIQHPLSHNYDGTECSTAQQDFVCLFSMTCRTNYRIFSSCPRFVTKGLNKSEEEIYLVFTFVPKTSRVGEVGESETKNSLNSISSVIVPKSINCE